MRDFDDFEIRIVRQKRIQTMTEINPNLNPVQQSLKANEPSANVPAQSDVQVSETQMTEKSLANMPQAAIGQSQVHFEGNIDADVQQFVNNPKLCAKAMEVGDEAEKLYEANGDENAPVKALNVAKAFADEFTK